jgi:hypothetical protein
VKYFIHINGLVENGLVEPDALKVREQSGLLEL